MIPKKLHYCWFGKGEKPDYFKFCYDTWVKHLPDWEIIEWNESNFDVNCSAYCEYMYYAGSYAHVSDYARYKVLHEIGGIYLDIDVHLNQTLNGLTKFDGVYAWESIGTEYLGSAFVGAMQGDIVMKKCVDYLDTQMNLNTVVDNVSFLNDSGSPEAIYRTLIPSIFREDEAHQEVNNRVLLDLEEFRVCPSYTIEGQYVKVEWGSEQFIEHNTCRYGMHLNAHNWNSESVGKLRHLFIIRDSELIKSLKHYKVFLKPNDSTTIIDSHIIYNSSGRVIWCEFEMASTLDSLLIFVSNTVSDRVIERCVGIDLSDYEVIEPELDNSLTVRSLDNITLDVDSYVILTQDSYNIEFRR